MSGNSKRPGPEPDRLRLDNEDWEDAVGEALNKQRPEGGWPKGEEPMQGTLIATLDGLPAGVRNRKPTLIIPVPDQGGFAISWFDGDRRTASALVTPAVLDLLNRLPN